MGAIVVVDTALAVVGATVVVMAERELVRVLPAALEGLAGEVHDVVKMPTATETRHNQTARMPAHHAPIGSDGHRKPYCQQAHRPHGGVRRSEGLGKRYVPVPTGPRAGRVTRERAFGIGILGRSGVGRMGSHAGPGNGRSWPPQGRALALPGRSELSGLGPTGRLYCG